MTRLCHQQQSRDTQYSPPKCPRCWLLAALQPRRTSRIDSGVSARSQLGLGRGSYGSQTCHASAGGLQYHHSHKRQVHKMRSLADSPLSSCPLLSRQTGSHQQTGCQCTPPSGVPTRLPPLEAAGCPMVMSLRTCPRQTSPLAYPAYGHRPHSILRPVRFR